MAIYLNDEQTHVALDLDAWRMRAEAIAIACDLTEATEWSVTFVEDEAIQTLNRDFRGQDRVTDVLSFAQEEGETLLPPDAPRLLGDVVIATQRAAEQAAARGHGVEEELSLLLIHGLLHLLGEDHDTPARKTRMWARQRQLLERLGLAIANLGDGVGPSERPAG